jgi:hypothetical protein
MDDVPPIPNFKIIFPKGKFNGLRAYYNIRTDPDLGLGFAALWRVACGCNACKEQLEMPWLPRVNKYEQPRYVANNRCILWQSYEGANDWKIFQLEPVNEEEETGVRDSIRCVLNALEARMSLTIQEGGVGAVGTIDKAKEGPRIIGAPSHEGNIDRAGRFGHRCFVPSGPIYYEFNMVCPVNSYVCRKMKCTPFWFPLL